MEYQVPHAYVPAYGSMDTAELHIRGNGKRGKLMIEFSH